MTNKDIQQLIDRYLEGETSPEEERVLAQELLRDGCRDVPPCTSSEGTPLQWQAVRMMLGELTMGEAEYDAIMAERRRAARHVSMKWRWLSAAASLLLLIGIGTLLWMKEKDMMLPVRMSLKESPEGAKRIQAGVKPLQKRTVTLALKGRQNQFGVKSVAPSGLLDASHNSRGFTPACNLIAPSGLAYEGNGKLQTPPLTPPLEGGGMAAPASSAVPSVNSTPSVEAPNLHYASLEEPRAGELCTAVTTADTVAYQDPARVDEFISKLASVHALPIRLTCSATMDSTVTSAVYVFPDKQEVDLFARLLQVACCYSDETPGYLLNFSHLQFFFQLKDLRRRLQYLWIAERVNGKILLYSTCSPIDANVSSACYQEYRDELMHTRSIHTKTLDI